MVLLLAIAVGVAGPVLPPEDAVCPPTTNGEIVVCRRRSPNAESPYRLPMRDPGFDPKGPIDSVARERGRLIDADGAAPDMTRGSCSAVGADGFTGCMVKDWREQRQQRGGR